MKIGNIDIENAYIGSVQVEKMYLGSEIVYGGGGPAPSPSLPLNSFWCNYNAKEYDPTTHSIPMTDGQMFNSDLVLNAAPSDVNTDYITLGGQFMYYQFGSAIDNIFRRSGDDDMTIIAKTSTSFEAGGEHSIFSCRGGGGGINYIIFNPANGCSDDTIFLHNTQRYSEDCPYVEISANPNIWALRIHNGSGYGQSFTDNTTFRSVQNIYDDDTNVKAIAFFSDSYSTGAFETWKGAFYWIYMSPEALTDAEIRQVISYNTSL